MVIAIVYNKYTVKIIRPSMVEFQNIIHYKIKSMMICFPVCWVIFTITSFFDPYVY